MKFKAGDRVRVLRLNGEEVDFYGTLINVGKLTVNIIDCTHEIYFYGALYSPNSLSFGKYKEDYYVLAEDEEDTEEPVIQRINDMYNEVPKEKEQKQKVELKKQYIIEVKKGLYVDYVDSKEAFYFTKDITKACVFKNREYPTKFAEIIDAKILEIKRYVEV